MCQVEPKAQPQYIEQTESSKMYCCEVSMCARFRTNFSTNVNAMSLCKPGRSESFDQNLQ